MNKVLLYVLHSGNLYGTERMALVTLDGLREQWRPVLFAPPGPVHEAARGRDIETIPFNGASDLFTGMMRNVVAADNIAFCATGVAHSLLFACCNFLLRRPFVHIHLVHGGTDERLSYGRKKRLNGLAVTFVAVSEFVRERLLAHGVNASKIQVVENFLPDAQIAQAPVRQPFSVNGVRNVVIVSRVDPIKRIDLLMEALDKTETLNDLQIRVLGAGWELEKMRERAAKTHPNVTFAGFCNDVANELAKADLLLHLCPVEPFGLAILEAMAARIPVLLPDRGGAAGLVEDNVSGYRFRANDVDDLLRCLQHLREAAADELNDRVEKAHQRLRERYSSSAGLKNYQDLFTGIDA